MKNEKIFAFFMHTTHNELKEKYYPRAQIR